MAGYYRDPDRRPARMLFRESIAQYINILKQQDFVPEWLSRVKPLPPQPGYEPTTCGSRAEYLSPLDHCGGAEKDEISRNIGGDPQASQHLRGLLDEFQKVKEIALQVVEKNACLEGRVRELARVKPAETRTFAEVTRTNLANKGRDGENRSATSERKEVLLVRAPEGEEETSSGEVREKLVRHFDPITLGLKDIGLRPIRGGVAVTTTSATAIKNLKDRIMEHEQTKKFETKIVDAAELEIRLISVDRHVDSEDISRILLEQNEIEGAEEDIKVVWKTDRKFGYHVTLRISNIGLAKEIVQKQSVNIGWSKCRVMENVYLPKCTYCTRLWHREGNCYAKKARCTECGGSHYYKDCREEEKSCPLCVDAGKQTVDHSMWDGPCPTFEDRYQRRRRELGFA
ncbi:hypothetical protein HPB51_019518 [Rhipicephalus microplus]|uniref:Gag-like protein n=1 Tax=Rhipicephalus microplus TaxID=6941 RepID=A0A9J6EBD4_RHIMP|nr:hypothetical protein HPB51_019518 [Rhipicephalus microplus]